MEIKVSPDQLWFYPLGTPLEECQSHLAQVTGASGKPALRGDGTYDGMYVEAFDTRWLASITFKDGKIQRQTLLLTSTDRDAFKRIAKLVKKEYGLSVRKGLWKPKAYIWDYAASQLILTIKEAPPLTGIYLILTAK